MQVKQIILTVLLVGSLAGYLNAQMTEGVIKMSVTDVSVSDPQMQPMIEMMKTTKQEIHFNQKRQKVIVDMSMGMKTQTFQDAESNEAVTYMDMMGMKMKMTKNLGDVGDELSGALDGVKIEYDKGDKKTILGRDCYKGEANFSLNGQQFKMLLYLTDEIKVPESFVQNFESIKLEGAPLYMKLDLGIMSMTYEAQEISDKLDPNFYTKPTGEYQEMTEEMLKQMGGGQLGF